MSHWQVLSRNRNISMGHFYKKGKPEQYHGNGAKGTVPHKQAEQSKGEQT